jgi:hypothetical protein
MAVLPQAAHALVLVDRQDDDCSGVLEDPAVERGARGVSGAAYAVGAECHQPVTPVEVA